MISRRAFVGTSAAMLVPPLAAPAVRASALTPVTLVQSSLSFNFVPLLVAQTAGYFRQEGIELNVVLAGGGPKAMTGLIGGGGQFSASVLFDGIMAHRRGLDDVRALATLSLFQGPLVVLADVAKQRGLSLDQPLKQRLEAMKGLRLGITTPGATSDMFMRYLFRSNGMNPDRDLQIVPLGGVSEQIAAMQAGRVDGASCLPPVDVITARMGLTVNVIDRMKDIPQLAGASYGTLYGLASYNKAHPEVTNGMARAITRATMLIAHDPDAARSATRPFLKSLTSETFDAAWAAYLPDFPTSPDLTEISYNKELEFEKVVLPASDAPVPYAQVVDASFVRRAMQDLGN